MFREILHRPLPKAIAVALVAAGLMTSWAVPAEASSHREAPITEQRRPVDAQRVRRHDLDVPSGGHLFQHPQDMPVDFDRAHVRAGVEQRNRERADARPHLDDPIAGAYAREAHDAFGGVGIGEEVLPERFARPDAVRREQCPDLRDRERHRTAPSTPKTRAAFARVTAAISTGDWPLARASASPTATT